MSQGKAFIGCSESEGSTCKNKKERWVEEGQGASECRIMWGGASCDCPLWSPDYPLRSALLVGALRGVDFGVGGRARSELGDADIHLSVDAVRVLIPCFRCAWSAHTSAVVLDISLLHEEHCNNTQLCTKSNIKNEDKGTHPAKRVSSV